MCRIETCTGLILVTSWDFKKEGKKINSRRTDGKSVCVIYVSTKHINSKDNVLKRKHFLCQFGPKMLKNEIDKNMSHN